MENSADNLPSAAGDQVNDKENSLEKIKKQLNSASGRTLLQGPLLKRSETETLKVKDEELHQLVRELRARDSTIKEIADKLSETAEAAESAALAAHAMDKERKAAVAEIDRLSREIDERLRSYALKLKESDENVAVLTKERDNLMKQRDAALQEAHLWRGELAKARERAVIMEAALVRAEERAKFSEADAEARVKEAIEKQMAAINAKEEALKEMSRLQTELRRPRPEAETLEHITNQQVQSCSPFDFNCQMEASEPCPQEVIIETDLSDAAVYPVTAETEQGMTGQMEIPPFDQSIHGTVSASCAANPSEKDLAAMVEHSHLESQCHVLPIDQVEVGSHDGNAVQLNSVDETPLEKIQTLSSTTEASDHSHLNLLD